jgi:hypothetical protein
VEAGAGAAGAAAAVSQLQADTAESGTTGEALKVVQELEHCLELVATSGLPPGIEPTPCSGSD